MNSRVNRATPLGSFRCSGRGDGLVRESPRPAPVDQKLRLRALSTSAVARFDSALLRANRALLIVMLAAMATMVFANVALRFLTDHSILWVEEVSRYLMIWLTFLGAGLVLRHGAHIGIDTLQESFPRWAAHLRALIFILLLGFFAFTSWIGPGYAVLSWS